VAIGGTYPLLIIMMMTISMFCYIEASIQKTSTGFPPHTFRLPVRTTTLVAIPMLLGVIAIPGVYVTWALVVYHPVGIELSLGWPVVILAAAMTSLQTVVWTMGSRPIPRMTAFTIAVTAFGGLAIAASGAFEVSTMVRRVMYLGLPILMLVNYRLSVAGVARYRCGDWPKDKAKNPDDSAPTSLAPGRRLPVLVSPARAQFWLEWRQFGFVIPAYIGFILGLLFFLVLIDDLAMRQFLQILAILILLPVGMGAMAGPTFARSGVWAANADLSPFGGTRPMTDAALASAKLKALAGSLAAGWLVVFGLGPLWVRASGQGHSVVDLWQKLDQALTPTGAVPALALTALGLVGLSWMFAGLGLSLALSGKRHLLAIAWVGSVLLTLGLVVVAVWTYRHPEALEAMLSWARRLEWLLIALAVVASVAAFRAAKRSGLLAQRTVARAAGIGALLLAVSVLLSLRVTPSQWRHLAGAATLLVALGLAPIATAPLALFSNRHR
jgi:hypothetical protein